MGVNETSKKENQEIYEYSKAFAIKVLTDCKLFTDTFGKDFAKKRIPLNYKICYTNVTSNTGIGGYHYSMDASITLCLSGKDGALLSVEDVEKDKSKLALILHEVVHACLERTKVECSKRGISSGTGILESYQEKGYTSEIGRGLNEGYTNWVCEKAGYKCDGYFELTTIMKELEIAIGPEKAMALGKGGIEYSEIFSVLNMDMNEAIKFLSQNDFIYFQDKSKMEYSAILENLSKIQNMYLRKPTDTIESIEAELQTFPLYAKRNKNPEYIKYISENGKGDTLENQLEYFRNVRKKRIEDISSTRKEIEGRIFEKYLLEDFRKLQSIENPSEEEIARFSRFFDLIDQNNPKIAEYRKVFDGILDATLNKKIKQMSLQIESEQLSIEDILEVIERYSNNYGEKTKESIAEKMLLEASKVLNSTNPEGTKKLIKYLQEKDQLEDFGKYKILKIKCGDESRSQVDAFIKDGKIVGYTEGVYDYMETPNSRSVSDRIETDPEKLFDFTLRNLEKMQNVVNQFLQMKEELMKKDPYARVDILGRVIIFTSDIIGAKYYIIDRSEELQEAELELSKPINLPRKISKVQTDLSVIRKDNIFSRIILNIKRKILKNEKGTPNFTEEKKRTTEILSADSSVENPWQVEDYEKRKEEYYESKSNDSSRRENDRTDITTER